MALLRFLFSRFWVWLEFVILVVMIGGVLVALVKACKRNRKVTAYQIGERWHVEIENATEKDAHHVMISAAYGHGEEDGECISQK